MRLHYLEESATHHARSYAISRVRGSIFTYVVVIYQGAKRDIYVLDEIGVGWQSTFFSLSHMEMIEGAYFSPECVSPREFAIRKCGGGDECFYELEVVGFTVTCNCFGFNRWKSCKHSDALADLVRRREI